MDRYRTLLDMHPVYLFLVVGFILAGCTFGGMSAPVQRTVESPNDSFDQAFTNAVRAMNDVGKVTNSDKQAGFVNGTSNTGIDLVVTLERLSNGGTQVNAKAAMPSGKVAYGVGMVDAAADRFLEAYKKYAQ